MKSISCLFLTSILIQFILSCATQSTSSKVKSTEEIESESTVVDSADQKTDIGKNKNSNLGQSNLLKKSDPDFNSRIDSTGSDSLALAIKSSNDEALHQAASELLGQDSKNVRAMNALAISYFKKNKLEAASYLLNKALTLSPKSSELYSNLALVHLTKGERREALKLYKKGLELNPKDGVIGANLGSIYLAERSYVKAELSLKAAYDSGIKDYKVLNNYAVALTANGKIDQAQSLYEKLVKENSGRSDIMLNYAILLIDQKQNYKQGLDILNRLKFVGLPNDSRNVIKDLESKAKAGLK